MVRRGPLGEFILNLTGELPYFMTAEEEGDEFTLILIYHIFKYFTDRQTAAGRCCLNAEQSSILEKER
jgi:hypothetical protein